VNIVYGSTETSSFVTALLKDELIFKPNSVGRQFQQINYYHGQRRKRTKPFEIGEIVVQSNALMLGYMMNQKLNK